MKTVILLSLLCLLIVQVVSGSSTCGSTDCGSTGDVLSYEDSHLLNRTLSKEKLYIEVKFAIVLMVMVAVTIPVAVLLAIAVAIKIKGSDRVSCSGSGSSSGSGNDSPPSKIGQVGFLRRRFHLQ